eukprot:CAMPEP_0194512184 /NCGR_PEP_ID=MMETSP0253-20130528/44074_1 /TAXON_ID=2966 /ORGANISM="Noctiluca scintillans" /LENGTH=48 /DNA_ID= /DNA_START= /DNA_END= /DNA_ORIENTATION=
MGRPVASQQERNSCTTESRRGSTAAQRWSAVSSLWRKSKEMKHVTFAS